MKKLEKVRTLLHNLKEVESLLGDSQINSQQIDTAAQLAMDACNPIDDVRASAKYRKLMVRNISRTVLSDIWSALREQR